MKRSFLKKVIAIVIATISISSINSVTANATWSKSEENKWNWMENGVKYVGWKMISEKWYHFNENGLMSTGWIKDGEKWYNLADSGAMNVGWLKDTDGKWYYLSEDGTMNVGWISENDKWYYMNSSGAMETGDLELNDKLYTFSDNGVLINSTALSSVKENDAQELNSEDNNDVKQVESPSELRKAYVTTESSALNVRSEASTASEIIGTLQKGTEIMVNNDKVDGFLHISSNGLDGWVSSAWISFDKPTTLVENQTNPGESANEDTDNVNKDNDNMVNGSLKAIRTVAPEVNNPCYYSNTNIFYKAKLSPPFSSGGNCTWYAWGRIWEITGNAPTDVGFNGNAYEWWGANKKIGKYKYGSTPKVGAIAVWKASLPGSGNSGHVAMVEKIEDGKVYISESMWHGGIFKYSPIYSTDYLYGYIYINEPNQ